MGRKKEEFKGVQSRKEKAIRRGCAIKADNRDQKAIEKLKWIHREKLKPVRKNIDD